MLLTSIVKNPNRCLSICSESYGWIIQTNKLSSHSGKLENYVEIAKGIRETAATGLGIGFAGNQKLSNHSIVAVYDETGNLQAAATVSWAEKKNILKIHKLVTALWNATPEKATHLADVKPVKGAGTAAIAATMQIALDLAAKAGKESVHVFLEPTSEAIEFYEKAGFEKVPNWKPVEFGSVCGMAQKVTKATLATFQASAKQKGREESTFVEEGKLPKTKLHFDKMLPGFDVPKSATWD